MNDKPVKLMSSTQGEDLPAIYIVNPEGALVHADPVYCFNLGAPHVRDDGGVNPPTIVLYDGGDEETSHVGVYFSLNSVENLRQFAHGLGKAADLYEQLLKENLQ